MEPGDKASLCILVQNDQKECIFRITFVSNRPYEAVLQEAIGLGQRMLKNEIQAVRVEIRNEHMHSKKPLILLTRDDVPDVGHSAQKPRLWRILQRLLKR